MKQLLERKATAIAHRAVMGIVGGIFVAVGIGFLTAAAWMLLAAAYSALLAAAVIGCLYAGAGILVLAFGAGKSSSPVVPQAASTEPQLLRAFMQGLQVGQNVRGRSAR